MLKENSLTIFNYVREHDGEDFTAQDIANATGIGVKSVNGSLTAMAKYHHIITREETEILGGKVKFIRLTDEGREFDPLSTPEKK